MKPVDVKSSIYIDHSVQCGDENHKFKVGVRVGILKYKYIFATILQIGQKQLLLSKVKNTEPLTYSNNGCLNPFITEKTEKLNS